MKQSNQVTPTDNALHQRSQIGVFRPQPPTGFGPQHAWEVRIGDGKFRYAYLCGGQGHKQDGEIRTYGESCSDPLDAVFISYLDSDHIGGVERLLSCAREVDAVVLPYIGFYERLLLLAQADAEGTKTGAHRQFCRDPFRWLAKLGVRRVVFVRHGRGVNGGAIALPDGLPSMDGKPIVPWDSLSTEDDSLVVNRRAATEARVMRDTQPLRLSVGGCLTGWCLETYVHSAPGVLAFKKRVNRELFGGRRPRFGSGRAIRDRLKAVFGDRSMRSLLGDCYPEIQNGCNLITMSLYPEPSPRRS